MMCSVCNENIAVIFITKIVENKQIQQGLCLSCARKQGINAIDDLLDQTGMTDLEIDSLNKQISKLLDSASTDNIESLLTNLKEEDIEYDNLSAIDDKPLQDGFATISRGNKDYNPRKKEKDGKDTEYQTKNSEKKGSGKKKKFLEMYSTNLTTMAAEGSIDEIIGRQKELERIMQILNRRNKNNPILIGEPGVGKTAIVQELAKRISKGKVPSRFINATIYALDMTTIVAGTQFRGQFESRMRGIIEEAKQCENVILFVDEFHNLMGAGEAEGAMNAANILKPALSNGDIQIVGATTLDEYRKHIEKDSALERRFQPVMVNEPSSDEAIEMLMNTRHHYEKYHSITIDYPVVKSAVLLSKRYITDRYLPDKAIDLIDEAGSKVNLSNNLLLELNNLNLELLQIKQKIDTLILEESIDVLRETARLKTLKCKIIDRINEIEDMGHVISLTTDDIAAVVESWVEIPVQKISEQESSYLLTLEDRINKRLIGQSKAISSVCRSIKRQRVDIRKKRKPSSFIFVGPTGVGKTQLVRVLTEELFGSIDALIRIDMSEYMEKHTVSKLVGAPPGYIGYENPGQLTEKVRRKPYSIILLDEIEKAHPDIFNMLLQVLEDGRLTDSHGRTVNFENTILIMTSNAGTNFKLGNIGFCGNNYELLSSKAVNALKECFRPEFLNRLDEIIVFTELSEEELKCVIEIMLNEVTEDVSAKEIIIEFYESVKDFILKKGDKKLGARPFRRVIQTYIEDELADLILNQKCVKGSRIIVSWDGISEKVQFTQSNK